MLRAAVLLTAVVALLQATVQAESAAAAAQKLLASKDWAERTKGLEQIAAAGRSAESEKAVLPLLDESSEQRFSEPNRWGTGELEEAPVRPELVVEVRYDKVQGSRFRHGTKLIRWREDKQPADCTWRELRPARDPNAPTVDELFG